MTPRPQNYPPFNSTFKMFLENQLVDERISRAIDNDHTAAMKAPSDSRKHMKKKSSNYGTPDMVSVCMLCKKAFKNALLYRKHMRLHTDKGLGCHICGKAFGKKHYLQAHVQSHGKTQFQCHQCHKRFTQKGNLNQHLKFHNTKKTFKCNICDKDFFQQEHLKTHLRHHNNERPFECELCHKSFNIKSSLQRHMNCHTGEKPFICDICNRGYTRRSVLMLHIQQVHENKKPFECDECHLCFSQKGNLQAHYRRKHLQPKSEGKRGVKDGGKGKRSVKRQHSRANSKSIKIKITKTYHIDSSSDDQCSSKMSKSRVDNTSLHSYACKIKTIESKNTKAKAFPAEIQFIKSPSKSTAYVDREIKREQINGQSSSYSEKLNLVSFDSSSSCSLSDEAADIGCSSSGSLSDEAADIGCSSSSSEDIPELNFPYILENDTKPLTDFDSLLAADTKVWDEYFMGDTNSGLPSAVAQCEISDILMSPSKSNLVLTKTCVDITDELFNHATWNDDYSNPLFTAEDLDNINDLTSTWGHTFGQNGGIEIKTEIPDEDEQLYNGNNSNANGTLNLNVKKMNLSEFSVQA